MEFIKSMFIASWIILAFSSVIGLIVVIGKIIMGLWGVNGLITILVIICFLGLSGLTHFLRHL